MAFTRDADARFRLYLNGELDVTSQAVEPRDFEHLKVARFNGLARNVEFTVEDVCRSPDEIRAAGNLVLETERGLPGRSSTNANTTLENSTTTAGIAPAAAWKAAFVYHGSGESWGKLHGAAHLERTADLPPLQTIAEAKTSAAKFEQFRRLANRPGDITRGQQVFADACAACHSVHGQGGKIGPVLDGAGANGVEALLRNILTPNAAMEAGYRRFRVETHDGEVQEAIGRQVGLVVRIEGFEQNARKQVLKVWYQPR